MKLENYKFKDERDYLVIKCLVRCLKEFRLDLILNDKRFDSYKKIIEKCYYSRETHVSESFYDNISFWPSDINTGFSNIEILLFLSLIINSSKDDKIRICKGLRIRFIRIFDEEIVKCISSYEHNQFYKLEKEKISIIAEALSKILDNKHCLEAFDSVFDGARLGIPF